MEVKLNTRLFTDTREIRPAGIIGILTKVNDRWIQASLNATDDYHSSTGSYRPLDVKIRL
ncbi:MAG: hypothetical protein HWE30_04890 [Methylocystaceae bacterium]|nr:hypothetical protein [Methylocystaceae bacterium]